MKNNIIIRSGHFMLHPLRRRHGGGGNINDQNNDDDHGLDVRYKKIQKDIRSPKFSLVF